MEQVSTFDALLASLESTPGFIMNAIRALSATQLRVRPHSGGFSIVEQVWHLADLEREGYALRIRRIQDEHEPLLANFDGDLIARERNYPALDAEQGIEAFRRARAHNIALLRGASATDRTRAATQEQVGRITLADLPRMMQQHDVGHREEIAALLGELSGRVPAAPCKDSDAA